MDACVLAVMCSCHGLAAVAQPSTFAFREGALLAAGESRVTEAWTVLWVYPPVWQEEAPGHMS